VDVEALGVVVAFAPGYDVGSAEKCGIRDASERAAALPVIHEAGAENEWGQSTRIDIFLALLMFRVQFSAWPANLDFSMPVRYIT
jgi:hypothetical protein